MKIHTLAAEIQRIYDLLEIQENKTILNSNRPHSESYDIAIISAYLKNNKDCLFLEKTKETDDNVARDENIERNRKLKNVLLSLNYCIIEIPSSSAEDIGMLDQKENCEKYYFVLNKINIPTEEFNNTMIKLGKFFCQDSVLLKPQNQIAYLYGTNRSNLPGLNKIEYIEDHKWYKEREFISPINKYNRDFICMDDFQVNTRYLINKYGKSVLEEVEKSVLD